MDDRSFTIITVAILILSPILLYMNGNDDKTENYFDSNNGLVPVWERVNQNFNTTGSYSYTLESGQYNTIGPESVFIDVDLPNSELGCTITDDCQVHLGLWLPDVPNGTKIPVIADVGPYYDDGDVDALTPANRLGKFLIENMVPHGYAVAQVSVFGTGMSNHCMDFMGLSEQMGIDAAVTWLGTQEWSNGNVGIVGKSYDGTTPWQAAMFGNPHLKTIIPISGLIGVHDLMWRNGSMEARGLAMHNGVYGSFGWDGDSEDWQTMCRGYVEGYANGPAAYLAGDEVNYAGNTYWTDRHFLERTIQNYNGSIYFIHGMQDWNVDPHMAFPAYKQLQQAGFEIKGLFGQWGHHYPDRPGDHNGMPAGRGAEAYPQEQNHHFA
jgi:predicted acyl esterase